MRNLSCICARTRASHLLKRFIFLFQLQSTLLTIVCATLQAIALVWYIMTYIPGGERGLRFLTSLCAGTARRQAQTMLPI